MNFTHAVIRPPGPNFASGLTRAAEGVPDYALAVQQHLRFCEALRACGLELTRLDPDPRYRDGTFVEDAAAHDATCMATRM